MSLTIDYYFSTSSPWTYLGSRRFTEIAEKAGASVNVYPVNYGEIFPVSGGLPLPKRAPQRQAYRMMELKRWRDFHKLPIVLEPENFPATQPISSLAIVAARETGGDALEYSNRLLAALWAEDRSIDDPAVVADVADAMGLDGKAIVEQAPQYAERFEADTRQAIDRGVFGAPSYVLPDGEIFWGQDRLDLLAWRLGV